MSGGKRGKATRPPAGARRTKLPRPTPEEIEQHPDRVRRMPKGGYAWLCHHCRQLASSESKDGKYLCYQHGGNRKAALDPLARAELRAKGVEPPKASGGQVKHGYYLESETKSVHELVAAYREAGLDPDDTDPDMLHLRARLERLIALEPSLQAVQEALEGFLVFFLEWRDSTVADMEPGSVTVDGVLATLDRLQDLNRAVKPVLELYAEADSAGERIEIRHARIIKMAQQRADTRLKNKAAEELSVFTMMVRRMMVGLSEQLPPDTFAALQKRFERDLSEVPVKVLEVPAVVKSKD